MFFAVSKIFWIFASPLRFCVLCLIAGLALQGRWRPARGLMIAATAALALILFTPFPYMALQPLEDRFPSQPQLELPPTGIIVLGGAIDEDVSHWRHMPSLTDAGDRIVAGALLARRYPQAKLVFSGGSAVFGVADRPSEAHVAKKLWLDMGVPEDQILIEDRSRNTFENAAFTKTLIAPQPDQNWLLVTSAFHMPRSIGIFRRLGFNVIAYPVNFRTPGGGQEWRMRFDGTINARNFDIALREYVGLIAYWLTDKTDALFPAP